ncbi:sulfotransferase [soil metagenome]
MDPTRDACTVPALSGLRAQGRRLLVHGSRLVHCWRGRRPTRPPAPPACPPGWRTGPPDFVGLGAQKAGTSWWNALIHQHPDVHRAGAQPKELHFFDAAWEKPFGSAEVERYWQYFPRPEGGAAGEWTPGYLIDFWTPELVARAAPDARILILLRDPLERLRSGLTHQLATSRKPLDEGDIRSAFQRGLYAPQLRRVLAAFPAEQVLIGQYEACRADPAGQLERTYAFVGLVPFSPSPAALVTEVNPTTHRRFEPSPALRAALLDGYADDMTQLPHLVPGLDLTLWPSARELDIA